MNETKRSIGKLILVAVALGIFAAVVSMIFGGCDLLPIRNADQLGKLTEHGQRLGLKAKETFKTMETVGEKIADLRQAYLDGEIDEAEFMDRLPALLALLKKLHVEYNGILAELDGIQKKYKELEEEGTPWYLSVLSIGIGLLLGGGGAAFKYRNELRMAMGALGITVGAIEDFGTQEAIKDMIASEENKIINKLVEKIDPKK